MSLPGNRCHDVKSLVINDGLSREPRDSSDRRGYPHPMGRRRAKSPFEDNPSSTAFSNGWRRRGTTIRSRHSIWCSTHWNMPASTPGNARYRLAGRRETAIDRAVGGAHPRWASGRGVRCDRNSRAGLAGGLKPEASARRRLRGTRPAHRSVARHRAHIAVSE